MIKADKTSTSVSPKYTDFADVFFKDLAIELLEHTKINDHTINLIEDYKPHYRSIYRLAPIELEILKTYIETNLANSFIKPFKFPIGIPIFFVKMLDGSFWLCIDHKEYNNLTIKN